MRKRTGLLILGAVAVIAGAGVFVLTRGETAKLPEAASMGPSPALPEPTKQVIPTVNIAAAKGWHDGAKPTPASGLAVNAFASGLEHPRWLYVLPNGDVLVAESN